VKTKTGQKKIQIHPSAQVDPGAEIGDGTVIGPYAIIGEKVIIGENCRIGSHTVIEFTEMGKDCVVFPFASLGLPAQHTQYKGELTKLVVGDKCTFREGFTAHRGTLFDKGITKIGNNGFFMAYSHIAHDCVVGNNVIMANGAVFAGHVEVSDNCFISALSATHQFTRIGKGAIISGGAMVSQDVAPFCIAQGDRALLRGLNMVGLKRLGIPLASLKLLKQAYKTMFLQGLVLEEAIKHPDLNLSDPWIHTFKEFFLRKKRGFVRPALGIIKPVDGGAE